jgi:hypothetical protein
MKQRTCSIDGCMKEAARRGWCPMHYQRWRQHGDLNRSRANRPKPPRSSCSVEDCDEVHEAQGYCNKHYLRWRKHGDPQKVSAPPSGTSHPHWRDGDIAYVTAHTRVYKARGKADHCSIEDCDTGSTTFHWANLTGSYADIDDYVQMCASHHFRYDRERRRTSRPTENYSTPGRRFG